MNVLTVTVVMCPELPIPVWLVRIVMWYITL